MRSQSSYGAELEQLEESRNRFISELSNHVHLYGITPSVGRLYGTMFFSDGPMTLDDMSEALGMSKTSMSTGIRALLDANMVERAWEKGIRKDLYQADEDWYKSFTNVFINRWRNATELNRSAIEETKEMLNDLYARVEHPEIIGKIQCDLGKLSDAQAYYEWLDEVISLFETGEIFDIVPKKKGSRKHKM
ncbi:GbsR/MarR family transcriptional regulator [Texcoconibacillus texcoconensis]|uniref:HTH-type transcriptional regulator n=1 Tax=Texcoconibacillus texcoconensis TaxID=1095777 RepID=A0A840QSC0_9BACI|nr:GbsR/MarR family transcriptional regulator [Texcoconibacillus texcoconensis]MBB5174240.1 DNA-binding transcriptional regulator GbsR (MarR family) [Texcoconibacillus texcoconensis]